MRRGWHGRILPYSDTERREAFISKVAMIPFHECWEWMGATYTKGYGQFASDCAHRWSWRIHRGPIPRGLHVLHRCDNRTCVNPDHLFLGTNLDNVRDMDAKGRRVVVVQRGEKCWRAKLTPEQVVEIRSLFQGGTNRGRLSRQFGVTWQAIDAIVNRRCWRHVP